MTLEQQRVFDEAVTRGLVKNHKQAYETGCAILEASIAGMIFRTWIASRKHPHKAF